jgi:lipopolysaccharide transport system permease protein
MPALGLALHFIRREIKNRYLGSFSGGLWALLQPLIQLAVYSFVFVRIFKAPLPEGSTVGYVPFLFMGLWPWNAFAESLSRSCTSIQDNAALIGKVAMPREVLVLSTVAATFLVQLAGFIAVCVVLRIAGIPVSLSLLPFAILEFVQLFVFALGLAFLLSALQVFVRDFASALPQLLMLWMFASPIFYSRESLPERYRPVLDWNPVTHYTEAFRAILLGSGSMSLMESCLSVVVALIVFALGMTIFRRLKPHFEDFL